jgi:hypothetical protein
MEQLTWNPLIGEYIGPPDAPYYVYLLIDPRNNEVFYVGKGTGDRFRAHGVEALLMPDAATPTETGEKLSRIREIHQAGAEPRVEFARFRIATEAEAYLVEATLIDALGRHAAPLTNTMRGHDSDFGLVSLVELTTSIPAILIKLGWWTPDDDRELPRSGFGYRPGMTKVELYDSTRAWWVMSRSTVSGNHHAVAVYQGVTRGVWEIDQSSWRSSSQYRHGRSKQRWAFKGTAPSAGAEEDFVGRVGRRVPRTRRGGGAVFGSGNPIAYWP